MPPDETSVTFLVGLPTVPTGPVARRSPRVFSVPCMDSPDLVLSLSPGGARWQRTVVTGGWCPVLHSLVYSGGACEEAELGPVSLGW